MGSNLGFASAKNSFRLRCFTRKRLALLWSKAVARAYQRRVQALEEEGVYWSGPDRQENDSIPRRLVARCCLEALNTPASIGRILEVTSSASRPIISLPDALLSIDS